MKLDFLRGRAVDYGAVRGADVEAFQKPTLGSLVFLSGGWSLQRDRNTQTHDACITVSSRNSYSVVLFKCVHQTPRGCSYDHHITVVTASQARSRSHPSACCIIRPPSACG